MELFDVLDDQGNKTGETKPRSQVHKDGDWHKAVHVWIINSKGDLLVQRRAPNKDSHPNRWDISCAGHIAAGDTGIDTVLRELSEELGISVPQDAIKFLFTLKSSSLSNNGSFVNNEFDDVYVVKLDLDIPILNLQKEELSGVKWITQSELKRVMEKEDPEYVRHPNEYAKLLATIPSLK